MSGDLRRIIGILKIEIDLERIGDLAADIARVAGQLKRTQMTKQEYIPHMAKIARRMLSMAMDAMANDDADMARQTTKWDYKVDDQYVKVRDDL